MTKVEQVAKEVYAAMAAHEKEYVGAFNDMWGTHTHVGDGYFDLNAVASAAINAMREPTEEMLLAVSSFEDIRHIDRDPRYYWLRMIDAALGLPPQHEPGVQE